MAKINYELQEKEIFERLWQRMQGKYSRDPWHYTSESLNPGVADFLQFCKKQTSGKILDVGCGNGKHILAFANAGFEGYGIDIAPSAIKFAQKIGKEKNIIANFQVGSVLKLPYAKNDFDIIIDCGCFHHLRVSQWPKYLSNINKVLKSGGYYFLQVFSIDCKATTKLGIRSKNNKFSVRNGHYFHFFDDTELHKIFDKNFTVIKTYDLPRANSPIIFKVIYFKKK